MLKCSLFVIPLFLALGCSSTKQPVSGGQQDAAAESGVQGPSVTQPDCSADSTDWPMFGQNVCNTASPKNAGGISVTSVANLMPKWKYDKAAGAKGDVSATPAVVGGKVYFPDWGGNINCLDAMDGHVIWSQSVADLLTASGNPGSLGGFVSRDTPIVTQGMVIFGSMRDPPQVILMGGTGAYVVAVSQDTGTVKWVKNLDIHPAAVISGSPVLEGSTLYVGVSSQEEYSGLARTFGISYSCCSFRGSVAALDVTTGQVKWQTYTISDDLYYGSSGPPEGGLPTDAAPPPMSGYTGVAIWSSTPVVDRKRQQLIVTTGDNYSLPSPSADGKPPGNWVDSIVALDMASGKMKWAQQLPNGGKGPSDAFSVGGATGPDSDFGAGANLFTAMVNGAPKDLVGAGQKSGTYFAVDADTGDIVWQQNIGPGSGLGGIQWGTATDGTRIYTANNNGRGANLTLLGTGSMAGQPTSTGTWTALDTATGNVVWQVPSPSAPLGSASVNGPVVVVNGVMFGGVMDAAGTMVALNAATGDQLWSFPSGATVYGGPAVSGGIVYWGCGYPGSGGLTAKRPLGFGTSTTDVSLYAFSLP